MIGDRMHSMRMRCAVAFPKHIGPDAHRVVEQSRAPSPPTERIVSHTFMHIAAIGTIGNVEE